MESSPISGTLLSEVPEMEYNEVYMSLCQQEENDRSSSPYCITDNSANSIPADSASKLLRLQWFLSATSTKKRNKVFSTIKTDHEVEVARATSVSA